MFLLYTHSHGFEPFISPHRDEAIKAGTDLSKMRAYVNTAVIVIEIIDHKSLYNDDSVDMVIECVNGEVSE